MSKKKHYLMFRGYFSDDIIEVSKTNEIPFDYYGCMGVPITALNKIGNDPESKFEILDLIRPKLDGKVLYMRIIIRTKLPPEIQQYLDDGGVFRREGDDLFIPLVD